MAVPKGARFRELVARLQEEAQARGLDLPAAGAASILEDRVTSVASQMRLTEAHVLRTYFDDDWPATMAEGLARSVAEREAASAGPPLWLPLSDVGRVIAALGLSGRYAAENLPFTEGDEARIVAQVAGNATCQLGQLIRDHPGVERLPVAAETVVDARQVLETMAARIGDGGWLDCRCGQQDHPLHVDPALVLAQVRADLALLGTGRPDAGWPPLTSV